MRGVRKLTAFIVAWAGVGALVSACSGSDGSPLLGEESAKPPAEQTAAPSGPTFHEDVEPILKRHCQKCHVAGGLAPFPLLTYEDAKPMSVAMAEETTARRMPPWSAHDTEECKPRLSWQRDARLTDTEIKTLADWHAAGAQRGDPKASPNVPPAPLHALADITHELRPQTPFTASGTTDQFRCFVLDPKLDKGGYVTGVHVVPGNKAVVHHAVVTTDPGGVAAKAAGPDGSFECSAGTMTATGEGSVVLDVWTPGGEPVELPRNIAMPFAAGAKIIMQIHYSPGGKTAAPDSTTVQLRVTQLRPEYLLFTTAVGNFPSALPNGDGLLPGPADPADGPKFTIPASSRNHVERMRLTVPEPAAGATAQDTWIYGVMAHQHLAGVDVKVDLTRGSDTQCLLQDRWDFHWQRMYAYDARVDQLPKLMPGDRLDVRCTYDNSMSNRRLAVEYRERGVVPHDLSLGEQTLDEMCLAIPQLLVRHP